MASLSIRPLAATELEACANLMAASEPWVTLQRDHVACLGLLQEPSRECYGAWLGEQLVGVLVLNLQGALVGYLQAICIAPERRGQGLGTALIAFAEERILRDHPNVFLCVSAFNQSARRLYERLGYHTIGELTDYILPGHSEFLLRKTRGPLDAYRVRAATPADIPDIVSVTNRAYAVERFCIQGLRTHPDDIQAHLQTGHFLILEETTRPPRLQGSVFVSTTEGRGYLGLLAVAPEAQGKGFAKALVSAVEARCRRAGCHSLELSVVNLRTELFPFYSGLGFTPTGILPFPAPEKVILPLHLVAMTKSLDTTGAL